MIDWRKEIESPEWAALMRELARVRVRVAHHNGGYIETTLRDVIECPRAFAPEEIELLSWEETEK